MATSKKDLKARHRKAIRRLERENDILSRARDRKMYWQNIVKNIENQIELVTDGQLELTTNQGEVL